MNISEIKINIDTPEKADALSQVVFIAAGIPIPSVEEHLELFKETINQEIEHTQTYLREVFHSMRRGKEGVSTTRLMLITSKLLDLQHVREMPNNPEKAEMLIKVIPREIVRTVAMTTEMDDSCEDCEDKDNCKEYNGGLDGSEQRPN